MRYKLAAAILCLFASATQAETLKVALPQKGNWDVSIAEFGQRAGIFKKEGLDLDFVYTEGGATTMQSVLSSSIDVGMQTGMLGIIGAYSKGAPARIISAGMTGGADIYWYTKGDSPLKSIQDAAGKTIAYSEVGSSTNLLVLALLKQAGVKAQPVRTGGIPATFTQLMSGQVDVGWAAAPFGLTDLNTGKIKIVGRGSDVKAMADETLRVNFVSAQTLEKKRDALIKFSRGYAESLEWVYSHPEAIDWFAQGDHIDRAIAQQAITQFYPKQNLQPFAINGLDVALQQALDYKFIAHPMKPDDLKGLIDIVYKGEH